LLSQTILESSLPAILGTEPRTREEIISRYRQLRAISKIHNNNAFDFMSMDAFREQARRLGVLHGKTFVLNTEDELAYVNDLAVYAHRNGRKRPLDRYAASRRLPAESDEARVLDAMRAARFVLLQVERRHPVAGLIVNHLARDEAFWLLDEGLEMTAPPGYVMATRVYAPEDFFMAAGIFVPLDLDLLKAAMASRPHLLEKDIDDATQDRRFAEAIYREAIRSGVTERVRFEDPGQRSLPAP